VSNSNSEEVLVVERFNYSNTCFGKIKVPSQEVDTGAVIVGKTIFFPNVVCRDVEVVLAFLY